MENKILNLINESPYYRLRALDATCKDSVFIVYDEHNNKIAEFNRTIYGAEFTVKNDTEYYIYFPNYNEPAVKIKVESPLQIFKIDSTKIIGYDPNYAY